MAKDNGRASEFIRRKVYKDKSQCYECGEEGHLSYACPKNTLGEREPPPKKERKRKKSQMPEEEQPEEEEESDEGEDPALDSLGAAIRYEQAKIEEEEYRYRVATGSYAEASTSQAEDTKKKKFKKDEYFSDEEDIKEFILGTFLGSMGLRTMTFPLIAPLKITSTSNKDSPTVLRCLYLIKRAWNKPNSSNSGGKHRECYYRRPDNQDICLQYLCYQTTA
ncbi:Zinc finger CCHC-type and RNA-binding motif-containing protein 1 [Branchiostoma belcheri]|nr:Zinc finger CCHC-type and RNA-binding motif-containing protein 1 [Branchiostoma belcheri]